MDVRERTHGRDGREDLLGEDGAPDALTRLQEELRRLRVERRLSMTALERRAELGHTTVSGALNGSRVPSEATVVKLARALGAAPDTLLRLRREAVIAARGSVSSPRLDRPVGDAFEKRYRAYVVERHSRLSVVGLDLSRPERTSWPLDTAYLSLEFSPESNEAANAGWLAGQPESTAERAEDALAGRDRVLVRGLAGGGKTTLVQWLAVSTAQGTLPSQLSTLSHCIPFVLPLRSLVRGGGLPRPSDFLEAVHSPLQPPSGWIDTVLHQGRGLLLVDGLDEVPSEQRTRTHAWLEDLIAAYPQSKVVVTSRPNAVPPGWLAVQGFEELTVRPMAPSDVVVFVTRWHAAAAAVAPAHEKEALPGLGQELRDSIRGRRDLALLATNPLLCALVCALHRDRRGHLPSGRMELYQAALSMLLVRRDRERDIEAPEGLELTEQQCVQLLQRLAYWLIRNGLTEMAADTAVALIADAMPAMPHVAAQGDAELVLRHLVSRTGLLRTPTPETVDFIHRTFQDYLGAKAAVEALDYPLLGRNAHDDQWEDVVKMAIGHARPQERAALLRMLIDFGDMRHRDEKRLHVLAAACLDYATELDPAIRHLVEERAGHLVPPRSREEAEALATIGPIIIDLLPGPEGLTGDQEAAVVHTAGLIGGDPAFALLKRYRGTHDEGTAYELQAAWRLFDATDYAREILNHLQVKTTITAANAAQRAALPLIQNLEALRLQGNVSAEELLSLAEPQRLRVLALADNPQLAHLGFLPRFPNLDHLTLDNCPAVTSLQPLTDSVAGSLTLSGAATHSGELIRDLSELENISYLALDIRLRAPNLADVRLPSHLTGLYVGETVALDSLAGIGQYSELTSVSLGTWVRNLAPLGELPALKELFLWHDSLLERIAEVGTLPQVTELELHNVRTLSSDLLQRIARCFPALHRMAIHVLGREEIDITSLHQTHTELQLRIINATRVIGAEHFPEAVIHNR